MTSPAYAQLFSNANASSADYARTEIRPAATCASLADLELNKLIAISTHGYYEANCAFGDKVHRVMLPIQSTALIAREAEEPPEAGLEIER